MYVFTYIYLMYIHFVLIAVLWGLGQNLMIAPQFWSLFNISFFVNSKFLNTNHNINAFLCIFSYHTYNAKEYLNIDIL